MAMAIYIQPIIEEIQSSLEIPSYSEHDKGFDDGLKYVLDLIEKTPTLTPPNEGAKDKNVPTNEPLTLEELKAEAKRQGYKLIKDKHPRFERCLCGHNVHQWVICTPAKRKNRGSRRSTRSIKRQEKQA